MNALLQSPEGDLGGADDASFRDGIRATCDLVLGFDGASSETRKLLLGDVYRPDFIGVWPYSLSRPATSIRA